MVLSWALQEGVSVIPRSANSQHIEELAILLDRERHPELILNPVEMLHIRQMGEAEGGGRHHEEL